MSDPLSLGTSVIAVVTVTFQSSKALYETIQSFRTHQTVVARLLHELDGLQKVLGSLQDHVQANDAEFAPLKFPLVQCSRACNEFKDMIDKCNKRSTNSRTSFRDWLKLSFMNGDIEAFTSMLAGYKSTVSIALADAHLRTTKVTLQALNEYKDLINDTQDELKTHLSNINHKLQAYAPSDSEQPAAKPTEIERIAQERDGIEECLKLCNQFLEQINTVTFPVDLPRSSPKEGTPTSVTPQNITAAAAMTLSTFKDCGSRLADNIIRLEVMRQTADLRLQSRGADLVGDVGADPERDIQRLQGEVDSTTQRLAYFEQASDRASSARVHIVEDISAGNKSTQLVASTVGDLIWVRGAKAGNKSLQFFGSVSDSALHQLFAAHNEQRFAQNSRHTVERRPANSELCASIAGSAGSSSPIQ